MTATSPSRGLSPLLPTGRDDQVIDVVSFGPAYAHVDRPVAKQLNHQMAAFNFASSTDGRRSSYSRRTSHDSHVFNRLMGPYVFAGTEAGISANLDVGFGQADGVANLFQRPDPCRGTTKCWPGILPQAAGKPAAKLPYPYPCSENAHIEANVPVLPF